MQKTIKILVNEDGSVVLSDNKIGEQGENQITILNLELPEKYNDYDLYLEFKNAEQIIPTLKIENNIYVVEDSITEIPGDLECQVKLVKDEIVWLSDTFYFYVFKSINANRNLIKQRPEFVRKTEKIIKTIKFDGEGKAYLSDDGSYKVIDTSGIIDVDSLPRPPSKEEYFAYSDMEGKNGFMGMECYVIAVDTLPEVGLDFFTAQQNNLPIPLYFNKENEKPYMYSETLEESLGSRWIDLTVLFADPDTGEAHWGGVISSMEEATDPLAYYIVAIEEYEGDKINEKAFYRLHKKELVHCIYHNQYGVNKINSPEGIVDCSVIVVDELPETVESEDFVVYFLTTDNTPYYYVGEWYPVELIITEMLGATYGGVINSKDEAVDSNSYYILIGELDEIVGIYEFSEGKFNDINDNSEVEKQFNEKLLDKESLPKVYVDYPDTGYTANLTVENNVIERIGNPVSYLNIDIYYDTENYNSPEEAMTARDVLEYTAVFETYTQFYDFSINSGTIKFTGDDCSVGNFLPLPNKHYEIMIWWDGFMFKGTVRGDLIG